MCVKYACESHYEVTKLRVIFPLTVIKGKITRSFTKNKAYLITKVLLFSDASNDNIYQK